MDHETRSSSSKPHCRYCELTELRRQARTGFWQTQVLTRLGYYPWECGLCRRIFLLKQRYARKQRSVQVSANGPAPKLVHES